MHSIIFSLGSNKGNRKFHLAFALKKIALEIGEIKAISSIYESKAWGNEQQKDFLNQVIIVQTQLDAKSCLAITQTIENQRKRTRTIHWGPRTLDIDILFYNQEIINTHQLIIPHLYIEKRLFVLVPLCEIYAEGIHPVLLQKMKTLLTNCEDNTAVVRYTNGI